MREREYKTLSSTRFRSTGLWILFLLGLLFAVSCHTSGPDRSALFDEPPANPFLADSPWPMTHRNPYCQASSPYPGPHEAMPAENLDGLFGSPGLITVAFSGPYPDGTRVVWGSSQIDVFKADPRGGTLTFIDRMIKEDLELFSVEAAISGAYTLVDRDGTFFVPRFDKIYAYRDRVAGDPASKIEVRDIYVIPEEHIHGEDDLIVGLNITSDGMLAIATKRGTVGVVSRGFDSARYLYLGGPSSEAESEEISNSIACDETGGIFVVTSRRMYRVQWTGYELTTDEDMGAWSAAYETGDDVSGPRLGPGSGSTPTLMGSGDQDRFVVITDGQELMHLVLLWRDEIPDDWTRIPGTRDRRIAAQVPVTFGDPGAVQSLSEQSVCVRGYGALVVNNQMKISIDSNLLSILLSNIPSIAPYGAEKFVWNPQARELRTAWVNREISLPNGIPAMSAATNLIYDVGQRSGTWTMEALDWETGRSVFHVPTGEKLRYNSAYAATEIGLGGSLVSGTLYGMIRLRP